MSLRKFGAIKERSLKVIDRLKETHPSDYVRIIMGNTRPWTTQPLAEVQKNLRRPQAPDWSYINSDSQSGHEKAMKDALNAIEGLLHRPEIQLEVVQAGLEEIFIEGVEIISAYLDGTLAGFGCYTMAKPGFGSLLYCHVMPEYRRMGLNSLLRQKCLQKLLQKVKACQAAQKVITVKITSFSILEAWEKMAPKDSAGQRHYQGVAIKLIDFSKLNRVPATLCIVCAEKTIYDQKFGTNIDPSLLAQVLGCASAMNEPIIGPDTIDNLMEVWKSSADW